MKIISQARSSVRYSIFVGALAGSVFISSGAVAATPLTQESFYVTVGTDLTVDYVLSENIDISKVDAGDTPEGLTVFGNFTGTLDGAGFTISNLTTPLFESIDGNPGTPTVKNLTLTADSATGITGNGALSNVAFSGSSIDDVHVLGNVNGTYEVGGLVGRTEIGVSIIDSSFTGSVEGSGYSIGGLVGHSGGDIFGSNMVGSVEAPNGNNVGGLAGLVDGDITNSSAKINGDLLAPGWLVGGLAGLVIGDITNSHAEISGEVYGAEYAVGGLVGYVTGNISDSYAVVGTNVSSVDQEVGGLAGYVGGNVSNSYAVIGNDVSGDKQVGGLAGIVDGNISNSYAVTGGDVIGTNVLASAYTLTGGLVGGLAGIVNGDIEHSYSVVGGSVTADFSDWSLTDGVGGLVGQATGEINSSYASIGSDVKSAGGIVGGLVGSGCGNISNSQAIISGSISGWSSIGGVAGLVGGDVSDSQASVTGSMSGSGAIGGLVGMAFGNIENSDSEIQGNVLGHTYDDIFIGGLVGVSIGGSGFIENSDASILGTISGTSDFGGLVGGFYGDRVVGSYFALNNVVGGITPHDLFGDYENSGALDSFYSNPSYVWDITPRSAFPTMLQVINGTSEPAIFATDNCLNGSNPYLVSMRSTYESTCPNKPGKPFRGTAVVTSPVKIEKTSGFKNNVPLPKDGVIAFVDSAAKFDIAKVID